MPCLRLVVLAVTPRCMLLAQYLVLVACLTGADALVESLVRADEFLDDKVDGQLCFTLLERVVLLLASATACYPSRRGRRKLGLGCSRHSAAPTQKFDSAPLSGAGLRRSGVKPNFWVSCVESDGGVCERVPTCLHAEPFPMDTQVPRRGTVADVQNVQHRNILRRPYNRHNVRRQRRLHRHPSARPPTTSTSSSSPTTTPPHP